MADASTRQSQIGRAVAFIEDRLRDDEIPSLQAVAEAAGMSPYHFHRIFKLMTGETCAQLMTRLRLAQSTPALEDQAKSVTEAAMSAGYASSQAYAKAFKSVLLETPSIVRNDPERLASVISELVEPQAEDAANTQIRICSLDPLEIVAVPTVGTYPDLVETYGALYEQAGGPEHVRAALGIFHHDIDFAGQDDFTFDAAIVPQGVALEGASEMERGSYVVIQHKGFDAQIPATLDQGYGFILAQADIEFRHAPCIFHYIDDPEIVPESDCRIDIYVPVHSD